MGFVFLFLVFVTGLLVRNLLAPSRSKSLIIPDSFILGSIVSVTAVYYLNTLIFKNLSASIFTFGLIILFFSVVNFKEFKKTRFSLVATFTFVIISSLAFLVFNRAFSYDSNSFEILISSNTFLDFGAHVPFIRSFSMGNNFPFEIPFYAGGTGVYYFMFNLYAGILEFLGLRIDIGLNFISAVSLTSLLFYIFKASVAIFKSTAVGLISVLFFFLPSNLSFLVLNLREINSSIFKNIWTNQFYLSNFPFDNSLIFNFFNFNTFLNQRHLVFGLAFAILVFMQFFELKKINGKSAIGFGVLIGLFFLWHGMIFVSILILVLGIVIINRNKDALISLATALFVSFLTILSVGSPSERLVELNDGFLVSFNSVAHFLSFWINNLGVGTILIPLGLILSYRSSKKLFLIVSLLFIVPNLVNFSARFEYDNHKFFNLWIVFMNGFSAYTIYRIFISSKKKAVLAGLIFVIFIFSGVANNLVIKNDVFARVPDFEKNQLMKAALFRIPPNEIVFTNGEIYDPMSIVGKRTYLGRSHYLYVYGEDPSERIEIKNKIFKSKKSEEVRLLLKKNHINYIVLYKNNFAKNELEYNKTVFEKFRKIYEDSDGVIYKI